MDKSIIDVWLVLAFFFGLITILVATHFCFPKNSSKTNNVPVSNNKSTDVTGDSTPSSINVNQQTPKVEVTLSGSGSDKASSKPSITNVYVKNEKLQTSEGCLVPFVGLIIVVLLVMIYFRLGSIIDLLETPRAYRGEIRSY